MTPDPDATRTAPSDLTRTAVPEDATRSGDGAPDDTKPAPGSPVVPDAPPGFVIERELGRGGMGVVYLARQMGLNRPVALKLIQAGDTGSALRFLAEAEAMAAVRHPHVAEVYHFGEHAGRPYLALEYCPGGDLTAVVSPTRQRGTDATWFRTAADLMAKVADGVAAAHALGIVHRDLKPSNILLAHPPGEPAASAARPGEPAALAAWVPKVTDFGLAKRDGGSDLTKTNAIMGTPAYMPPEQAKGETKFVGPPADVWALGVMLYEAVTSVRPFTGADHWAILAAVQRGTFAPPRRVVKDIPRDLELICLKCLKTEPHERYPSASELACDLHNWLDGKPISARPAGVIEQATKWAKRNKRLAAMGLAVFLTMAAATGVSVSFGLEANKQASHAQTQQRKFEEATREADFAGALFVTERDLAQARALPTINFKKKRFAWWVYIPEDGRYAMRVGVGGIPKKGYPPENDDAVLVFPVEPAVTGQLYLFELAVRQQGQGWDLDYRDPNVGVTFHLPPVYCVGFESDDTRVDENLAPRSVVLHPGEDRLLLLRQLHLKPPPSGWAVMDTQSASVAGGLVVWIERVKT